MTTDNDGDTALHDACFNIESTIDVIIKLIHIGGKELLTTYDIQENSPLFSLLSTPHETENKIAKISFLITKGIKFHVAGEFSIGSLFDLAFDEKKTRHSL
jgi:hypothetical protein